MGALTRSLQALVALWSGAPEMAHQTRAGRLASAQFGIAALFLLASAPSLETRRPDVVYATVAVAALTALVLAVLPWERWGERATMAPVWWGLLLMAVPLGAVAQTLSQTLVFFSMVFVYVGLTQPPRTSLRLLPAALLAITPQLILNPTIRPLVPVVSTIVVAVLMGELLAANVAARRVERRRLRTLLDATRALSGATSQRQVRDVLREAATALLGAADVALFPLDRMGPATGPVARCLATGRVLTLSSNDAGERPPGVPGDAAYVVLAPLQGASTPAGVAAAWWSGEAGGIDASTSQVLLAVCEQAGQVLERLAATARLQDDATTDPLTGLPNRRQFFDRLSTSEPGDAVVLVDLDFFKTVNDTHGHQHGDQLLAQFAQTLQSVARDADCAARYGGEEFVLFLPGAGAHRAVSVVERLRRRWADRQQGITFSAGIAEQEPGVPATTTLARADDALYDAKRQGRNRTVVAPAAGDAAIRSGPGVPEARTAEHDLEPRDGRARS